MEALTSQKIKELQKQGLTNNQVIRSLQQEGYKSAEIFDALNQASTPRMDAGDNQEQKKTMPSGPDPFLQQSTTPQEVQQPLNKPLASNNFMAQGPPPAMAPQQMPRPMNSGGSFGQEELIEAIIDEKWNDLLEDVNKIIAWKERTTQRIDQLDQQMKDLKEQFDKLHQAVIGKVGEYDQHILQVGAEVKAMEKVFSKVLPVFTENVGELSRIADTMKKNSKQK